MPLQFVHTKPLQASKLTAIVTTLLFSAGVFFGLIPSQGITSLFLMPMLSLALALVITAETLLAGYRSIRTDGSLFDRLADRPLYAAARIGEVVFAILSAGAFIFIIDALPDGPMSGPGAIGLFFIIVGLALLVLVGSLIRTLTEYYYYRQNHTP